MPTYETTALPPSFAHIDVLREMDFRAGKYPVELLNALLPYNLGWRQAEARKPMIDFFGKLIHPGDLYFRSETLTSGRSEYRRLTVDSIERVLSLVFMLNRPLMEHCTRVNLQRDAALAEGLARRDRMFGGGGQ